MKPKRACQLRCRRTFRARCQAVESPCHLQPSGDRLLRLRSRCVRDRGEHCDRRQISEDALSLSNGKATLGRRGWLPRVEHVCAVICLAPFERVPCCALSAPGSVRTTAAPRHRPSCVTHSIDLPPRPFLRATAGAGRLPSTASQLPCWLRAQGPRLRSRLSRASSSRATMHTRTASRAHWRDSSSPSASTPSSTRCPTVTRP